MARITPGSGKAMATSSTASPPRNNTAGTTLPAGSQAPTWNGVLVEPHYVYSPQLIFIGRYETIRMSQQANGSGYAGPGGASASNLGNISTYTIGYPLQPVHDQPRRLCLAQRIQLAAPGWHRAQVSAWTAANINTSELLTGI